MLPGVYVLIKEAHRENNKVPYQQDAQQLWEHRRGTSY
jgi:hypothetical protein